MKKLFVMAAALILSVFSFGAVDRPAAAAVPAIGASQAAPMGGNGIIELAHGGGHGGGGWGHGGGGGGWGHGGGGGWGRGGGWGGGWGWGPGIGLGLAFGGPYWGYGPSCGWRCGPYRCWRVCW